MPLRRLVGHGPLGEQRGPAPADVLEDRLRPHDVQVRVLLAGEGGRRQVLRRCAGPDGVGKSLAGLSERAGDRRREIARHGDPFDGPADPRTERADGLPVVGVQSRQLIELLVDGGRFRHEPPEGVRGHAETIRHADAFDPRKCAQMCALTTDEFDLRLVHVLKTEHILLAHLDTSVAAVLSCTAKPDRITDCSHCAEPVARYVLIPRCLPSDESGGGHPRTSAPTTCKGTAGDTTGPTSPRFPYADNNTRTSYPVSAACGLGRRFCAVTRALPQAPYAL